MRMMMRLQKTQFPVTVFTVTTPGYATFDKSRYALAGFSSVMALCVGAAGGSSGNSTGTSNGNVAYGAGGGGGGMLRGSLLLRDLAQLTLIEVGAAGVHGADKPNTVNGESGTDGGQSAFGPLIAYGGKGATGGRIDQVGGGVGFVCSKGGNGGHNDEPLGTFGQGGNRGGGYPPPSTPGDGTVAGNVSTLMGGGGGGGGAGRVKISANTETNYQAGGEGNGGFSAWTCPGGGGSGSTFMGGPGGGADINDTDGTVDYYGSHMSLANPNGAVRYTLT
jgi:hypothetical protein